MVLQMCRENILRSGNSAIQFSDGSDVKKKNVV
jgi:hypothetical protein